MIPVLCECENGLFQIDARFGMTGRVTIRCRDCGEEYELWNHKRMAGEQRDSAFILGENEAIIGG